MVSPSYGLFNHGDTENTENAERELRRVSLNDSDSSSFVRLRVISRIESLPTVNDPRSHTKPHEIENRRPVDYFLMRRIAFEQGNGMRQHGSNNLEAFAHRFG